VLDACAKARATADKQVGRDALRGDVDGDGAADSVALVRVRTAPERCGAFLVVRTGSGTLTRALSRPSEPDVPALNGLASLGSRPGLHIVVTTWQGASTEFARLFAVRGGRIAPVATGTADNTFPYEGSVTHLDAVDCAPGGLVVASGWFARGQGFGFFRHFYRVGAARLVAVRNESGASRSPSPIGPLREFSEPQPFPSCMRVRATS
jgi:hypothetical protein